jgi:protein-disulfide isomerase
VAAIEAAKEKLFSEWKTLPKRKIEVKSTDAVFGNKNAKIQIVEFSDFQCPYCKFASRIMGTILNQYKDKVLFIFKNYPLDSSCNSALVYPMHPQACKLARLATCANAKGKFWEFQEYIFSRDFDALTQQNVSKFFTEVEFSECLSDEKSLRLVQQEIEEGNAWDIKGTPAIFINGKAANIPLTIQNIKKLIEMEE